MRRGENTPPCTAGAAQAAGTDRVPLCTGGISAVRMGDVVRSTAGRDAGCPFFVVRTEAGYLWLADGRHRRAARPKRKKQKHVMWVATDSSDCADALRSSVCPSDRALWRALRAYRGGHTDTAAPDAPKKALGEVD